MEADRRQGSGNRHFCVSGGVEQVCRLLPAGGGRLEVRLYGEPRGERDRAQGRDRAIAHRLQQLPCSVPENGFGFRDEMPPSHAGAAMKIYNSVFGGLGSARAKTIGIYATLVAGNALAWVCASTLFSDK